MSAADSAPAAPAQRRRLRLRLIVAGCVVGVLAVAYGVAVAVQDSFYSPDGPVKDLFAALAARDGSRVGEIGGCPQAALCQTDALRTGYQPPEQMSIVDITYGAAVARDPTRRPNKNRAVVKVRYQLAGAVHEDSVGLQRPDSGMFRPWSVSYLPGGHVDVVSTTAKTVRMAGADVTTVAAPAAGERTDGAVWALPGVYTLTAAETPLTGAVPATVVVAGDVGRQQVKIDVTIKPGVDEEVNRQVKTHINACVQKADFQPSIDENDALPCPFRHISRYTFTKDPKWTIVDYPKIELRKAGDGTVTVRTTIPGHVQLTYLYSFDVLEPREWTPETTTFDVKVGGQVTIVDGTVAWTS